MFHKLKPYLVAVLAVGASTALRLALIPLLGPYSLPFLTYFAAVLLGAWFGGMRGGIFAGVLSMIAARFIFIAPRFSAFPSPAAASAALAVFALDIALILYINHAYRRAAEALRRSERERAKEAEELSAIYRNMPVGLGLLSKEMQFIRVNEPLAAIDGMTVGAHPGKTVREVAPCHALEAEKIAREVIERRRAATREVRSTTGATPQEARVWDETWFPVFDGSGEIHSLGVAVVETTEQKEHERQVQSQLEAMELLNALGQRCLTAGSDLESILGEIVEAAIAVTGTEKGLLQLFDPSTDGLKIAAQRGLEPPFLAFFDVVTTQPSACGLAMKSRARVVVSDVASNEEFSGTESLQVVLEAGVRAIQSTPLISSSGNLLGMISTYRSVPTEPTPQQLTLVDLLARQAADFLERKQAERALRASEAQLRQLLRTVPAGITRCSRELRYLAANPAYAALLGVPLNDIVGRSIPEVIGPDRWEIIRPFVERVLQGERVEYEAEMPQSRRFLHVVYIPEKDEQGEVVGWTGSITDMTAYRDAKENLAKLEKFAAAGQLAASLAHEINNPLNAVINCLFILQTGSVDVETSKNLVDAASSELERLGRIVNQSLSYYRSGAPEERIDVASLIRDSLQIFARKLEHAGIKVTEKIDSAPAIAGFPDEMRQVIDNLLLNAIEAMPKGGVLGISVHSSTHWRSGMSGLRVTVADTGCGMPAEIVERVFEPFFTTKAEKGTGLGLWVVKGILAKHGATVRVRSSSQPGRTGTAISFLFPAPAVLNKKPANSADLVAN